MSVLVRYDLRGIQSYIFRTPRLREIRAVGALPEQLVFRAMLQAAEASADASAVSAFGEDALAACGITVLDRAGGNAVAVFRSEETCRCISRGMARIVREETHALELVYAWVPCTADFAADHRALAVRLGRIKSAAPSVRDVGAFPVCAADPFTGAAVAGLTPEGEPADIVTLLRLRHAPQDGLRIRSSADAGGWTAVIHIDGNGMGERIARMLDAHAHTYEEAAACFARITVRDAFAQICAAAEAEFPQAAPCRLIQAGDDITYLLPAQWALPFTKRFLERAAGCFMLQDGGEAARISACAGIAYCTAHYPFSEAYETAERLCMSAKQRGAAHRRPDGLCGCWLDFAVCTGARSADVQAQRAAHPAWYRRPYCVATPVQRNKKYDLERLLTQLEALTGDAPQFSPAQAAAMRRAYTGGSAEESLFDKQGSAVWYDALELAAVLTAQTDERE